MFDNRTLFVAPALAAIGAPLFVAPDAGAEAAPAQATRTPRGSLCAVGEQVIFHCGIGRKMVSVCGGRATAPHAQYRFGTPGDIELAYPGPGQSGLTWARMGFSSGGALQIRFSNGGYDYVVDSRIVRTGFDRRHRPLHESTDSLIVMRRGRLISQRTCTTPARSDAQAEAFMPEGAFLD
jgi:hypothetical protein